MYRREALGRHPRIDLPLHVDGHHLRSGLKEQVVQQAAPPAYQFTTENTLISRVHESVIGRGQYDIRLLLLSPPLNQSMRLCQSGKALFRGESGKIRRTPRALVR